MGGGSGRPRIAAGTARGRFRARRPQQWPHSLARRHGDRRGNQTPRAAKPIGTQKPCPNVDRRGRRPAAGRARQRCRQTADLAATFVVEYSSMESTSRSGGPTVASPGAYARVQPRFLRDLVGRPGKRMLLGHRTGEPVPGRGRGHNRGPTAWDGREPGVSGQSCQRAQQDGPTRAGSAQLTVTSGSPAAS